MNNPVSLMLLLADLESRRIDRAKVCCVALRDLEIEAYNFGVEVVATKSGATGLGSEFGRLAVQARVARQVGEKLRLGAVSDLYVPNANNLLCNHLIWCSKQGEATTSVLVEGLLNFTEVDREQHGSWRVVPRRLTATAFRLQYRRIRGHISGVGSREVARVVTFSSSGLVAPREKVVIRDLAPHNHFEGATRSRRASSPGAPSELLVIGTGLHRLAPDRQSYAVLIKFLCYWIREAGYSSVKLCRHPSGADEILERELGNFELTTFDGPVENFAHHISSNAIIGTGTTPLATLKLLRPDIRSIDFGADMYAKWLGDTAGIDNLFRVLGVERVEAATASSNRAERSRTARMDPEESRTGHKNDQVGPFG